MENCSVNCGAPLRGWGRDPPGPLTQLIFSHPENCVPLAVRQKHAQCIGERPLAVQSLILQGEKLRPREILSFLKGKLEDM